MSQYLILPTNQDIQHHGVLGMSWGKRNGPPYPLNASGRASLRKQKKEAKAQEQLKKKQAIQEKKEKKLTEEKERILKSGTATEALQYKGMWTVDELRQITNRIDLEVKLSGQASKETQTGLDKLEKVSKTVGRLTSIGEQGVSTYNLIAKIYNAKAEKDNSPERLPLVSGKTAKLGEDVLKAASEMSRKAGGKK